MDWREADEAQAHGQLALEMLSNGTGSPECDAERLRSVRIIARLRPFVSVAMDFASALSAHESGLVDPGVDNVAVALQEDFVATYRTLVKGGD